MSYWIEFERVKYYARINSSDYSLSTHYFMNLTKNSISIFLNSEFIFLDTVLKT
jgi:hypothetical protein